MNSRSLDAVAPKPLTPETVNDRIGSILQNVGRSSTYKVNPLDRPFPPQILNDPALGPIAHGLQAMVNEGVFSGKAQPSEMPLPQPAVEGALAGPEKEQSGPALGIK